LLSVPGRGVRTDQAISAFSQNEIRATGEDGRTTLPSIQDDRGPLYVCEGEKKTLAAHQAGMNAAGIGGLWNWLTNGDPIDDLKLIEWDGREVIVIPDSDVFGRQDLLRAVYALGCELRERGASVSVAQIPQPGQKKVGLDDYLVAGERVDDLETFTLGGQAFRSASFWYARWKLKAVLRRRHETGVDHPPERS
jgi:Domain of unknown function (DUF3854)